MTVEAERSGRNSQSEPPGGASEQSHNGTRPKRYSHETIRLSCAVEVHCITEIYNSYVVVFFRTAPVPKYLKMHYVKEEIGDSKGASECEMSSDKPVYHRLTPHLTADAPPLAFFPPLSLSRCRLSPAGPPRVCVFPRHLCLSPTPGGPLLGQTLPAAA